MQFDLPVMRGITGIVRITIVAATSCANIVANTCTAHSSTQERYLAQTDSHKHTATTLLPRHNTIHDRLKRIKLSNF